MQPGELVVGMLYKGGLVNGLPVWKQPGGIGTQVFPANPQKFPEPPLGYPQVVMSFPSYYVWGCLHTTNMPEIFEVFDPYLQQRQALVCCPECSYIQEILPYEQYQDYLETPLIIG